jgi:hypothetical protein
LPIEPEFRFGPEAKISFPFSKKNRVSGLNNTKNTLNFQNS